MRFADIFAASLVAPLVAAHGGIPGAPKVFGLGGELRQRRSVDSRASRRVAHPRLNARQGGDAEHRCGAEFGGAVCAPGYCCSSAGWCGQGPEFCQAPDCQFQYGPGCDANQLPSGGSTRPIPRPQLGNVPYGGEGVYACSVPGTVAITYDDGPYIYTNDVLDQFAAYGFKATFFVTGNNIGKGAIDDETKPWPAIIRRMIAEGHQVASHTWSHQDLGAITQEQRIDQMVKNEMAISNIIGKFPTYMRPPYSSCAAGTGCQEDLEKLGYVISYFDLDTDDYNNVLPEKIQKAKDNFANLINLGNPLANDYLAIAHDIHQQTALNLTGFMLDFLVSKGYRGVTIGECLGEPEANWYRAANGRVPTSTPSLPSSTVTSSAPTATATGVTVDGTCGVANGLSCIGFEAGTCCSSYGWCGSSVDHCGTGCQSGFGTCGSPANSSSAASSSTSAAPTSVPTGPASPDGTCGGSNGYTCIGFEQGECCSQYGWCGSTADHCGTGCNPLFGKCGDTTTGGNTDKATSTPSAPSTPTPPPSSTTTTTTTTTAAAPTTTTTTKTTSTTKTTTTKTTSTAAPKPTGQKSRDGTCGGRNGYHCVGFVLGECCNAQGTTRTGFCGATRDNCEKNCNPAYGKCGKEYVWGARVLRGMGWGL